jgi:hypothetical protein
MSGEWGLPVGYRSQVLLATAGHAYGPQFGPANPPEFYYEPRILACGCSEEDCNGLDCGRNPMREVPADYEFWLGES